MPLTRTFFAAVALIACSAPAFAQTTIDHNKALAGGSLPGDTAGYPIDITQPGHYKLMSNLVVPAGVPHGITIVASDVTLDLNGFSVMGPQKCSYEAETLTCTGNPGLTAGIVTYGGAKRVTVRNGRVTGFGGVGIYLSDGVISDVTASSNGQGLFLGDSVQSGQVRGNNLTVSLNKGHGLVLYNSLIDQVVVYQNKGTGIYGAANHAFQSQVTNAQVWSNAMAPNTYGVHNVAVRNTIIRSSYSGIDNHGALSLGGNLQGVGFPF